MTATLSRKEAQRIALAAQGLSAPRPEREAAARNLARLADRLSLHQIDSVNVLARAHYMPAFSRFGSYPTGLLDSAAWGKPRRMFEYWAHEASLLPLELHPLLRWRMDQARQGEWGWSSLRAFAGERRAEADAVLARLAADGPLAASEFERKSGGGWWQWSDAKQALEFLFRSGEVGIATRRGNFERVYDRTDQIIPPAVLALPTPSEHEAQRGLLERSARALGIATARDLRDYFRLSPAQATPRIAELAEAGTLIPVQVEGWRDIAYLHPEARRPRRATGRALLSPFDPLVWERARTERLFGFRYRIEIYTPAAKRIHGYYVLPFLLRGGIAARVDLKADRVARRLLVLAAHGEPGRPADTAAELAQELRLMASWLGLEAVRIGPAGDLAPELQTHFDR